MLYSEIKREVLSHINMYSIAGAQVSLSYNNQADYLNRIPLLINEALMEIRTTVKPELVVHALDPETAEEYGDMYRYSLPENLWCLRTGGVSIIYRDKFYKTNNYRLQGNEYILVPKEAQGAYTIEYYRYPVQLPIGNTLSDNYDLEEDAEILQAASYHAAAHLVLQEDEFAYTQLMNNYETRLARLSHGATVEVQPTQDAYIFNEGWWVL